MEWLTKQQLARELKFSPRWVELRVREGMPHARMGGRMRFRLDVVEAWLQGRSVPVAVVSAAASAAALLLTGDDWSSL